MVPHTYPTTNTGAIRVYVIPSIVGLAAWKDYIPVVYRT
jgi:hypothetical protein